MRTDEHERAAADRWRRALLASCAVLLAIGPGCGRDDEAPASRPMPVVAAPPPPPLVAAPPAGPRPLQPARDPILSTAVPEGFARDPATTEQPDAAWVHVRGRAKLDDVVDFYTRYLDPGTPAAAAGPGTQPRCRSWAVGPRPGCTGDRCVGRYCLDREGGLTLFSRQHPKPPGSPAAEVNVSITTVGADVRITIENESLMELVRQNLADERSEGPAAQDLTKYRSMEELPPELID
ncbi:MAG: hypothetical protein HY907_18615 [Deltaproteobacteria bacterium]|nr:hypothetical protein [Deltaproteobacteria bacterium]